MSTFQHAASAASDHLIVSLMLLALHATMHEVRLPKGLLYWIIKLKVPPDIFEETYHAFYADLKAESSIVRRWKMVFDMIFHFSGH